MTFLAPLYIAGLLAIALPIVFHLIRRTPQGRQVFSSLMFLAPSPPRLTRRSRLSNIVLLLLRAAALAMLALAFARPFFSRSDASQDATSRGRRIALLVDTSASMRREDLWKQASDQAEAALRDLSASDEAALLLFDRTVRPAFSFAEWNALDPAARAPALRARLAEASPTWSPTRLGESLATAADLLAASEDKPRDAESAARQLILISDVQQGGRVEALQGHQWPANVLLDVRAVRAKQPGNAGLHAVTQAEVPGATEGQKLRVRVSNEAGATREQFALAWADARGPLAQAEPIKVYVPPGRSQLVRVPWPKGAQADRLVLQGDDSDFDNTLFVVPPRVDAVRVVYLGDEVADDVKGMRYYLQSAFANASRRRVDVVARRGDEPLTDGDLLGAGLVVIASIPSEDRTAILRRYAEAGGDVLWVLREAAGGQKLSRLAGGEPLEVSDPPPRDFALVSKVDQSHPLFAAFVDSRFTDFTRVHFWKHRRVKLPDGGVDRVLAWFDDGDPFVFERPLGRGRLLVATSGWHPADSQLALSTKFVPLLDGMLRHRDDALADAQYAVGDAIPLPPAAPGSGARTLLSPAGAKTEAAGRAVAAEAIDRPGIYRLTTDGRETALAVNLPPDESRTAPLASEAFEQWGATLGASPAAAQAATARAMQLRLFEQEGRQKLWRWVILGTLGLLAIETALAGRLARQAPIMTNPTTPQVTA